MTKTMTPGAAVLEVLDAIHDYHGLLSAMREYSDSGVPWAGNATTETRDARTRIVDAVNAAVASILGR